ncbi:MAG: hypothetical protein Q9227_006354 [Pyrenula ochraceoflavens]
MVTRCNTWVDDSDRTSLDQTHSHWSSGDTKAGTLIAQDRFGNKYYENLQDELPYYKSKEFDPSQMEPGWHAWMSYMVDKPPSQDKIMQMGVREWEQPEHKENPTLSRGAYRPYNT